MEKWKVLGQAFENTGLDLLTECENMETNCEVAPEFEELYSLYVMLLETQKAQRKFIASRFDAIDNP